MKRPTMRGALGLCGAIALTFQVTGCPEFGDQVLGGQCEEVTPDKTWEGGIRGVFEIHCWSCHGETLRAGAPFPLVTYGQASDRAAKIQARVVVLRNMPPDGWLADEPRERIAAWLNCGAVEGESSGQPDAEVEPDTGAPEAPTHADPIKQIIDDNCALPGCHAGTMPANGLDLSTYESLRRGGVSGDPIAEGDPDQSLLIDRLRGRDALLQMPLDSVPLPEEQIRTFEAWIEAGAPEGP